jgi:hypothetical protein
MKSENEICYLCGKELNNNISKDHVPPRQFYPSSMREKDNPNLFTLPTHSSCNKLYEKDEVYFVQSLGPLANTSFAGKELWKDISKQTHRPESKGLIQKILNEFEQRPSGIILPPGMVGKRFDVNRIERVIWKITRGLFFKENKQFLLENIKKRIWISYKGKGFSPFFPLVRDTPQKGDYPVVFDYKYLKANNMNLWAMHIWETFVVEILFQYPIMSLKTI